MITPRVINVETVVWNQLLTAKDGKQYYMLAHVLDVEPETYAVTPKDGNGSTLFFCSIHGVAYPVPHGVCADCQNKAVEETTEDKTKILQGTVTACDTP